MSIKLIIGDYKEQYSFLALNERSWNYLQEHILELIKNKTLNNSQEVIAYLNSFFGNYINKQISDGKIRIINNILILLQRKRLRLDDLLREFLEQLEICHIHITETFYDILKSESKPYQSIIKNLGISDLKFCELSSFLHEYSFYFRFLVYGKTLKEIKDIFDEYYFSLGTHDQKQVQVNINLYVDKFRYLIYNDAALCSIYQICLKKMPDIPFILFRRTIFSLSIDQLNLLIEEYRYNQIYDGSSVLGKYDNLWLLLHDLKCEKDKSEALKCRDLKRKQRALYSYFERIKPELSEEDKKVIDTLYSHLPKERQDGIQGYIEGRYHQTDKIGKKASSDIVVLQKQFKRYLETGVLNLRDKQRALYSYFESIKPELSEEDKKVIDTLYFRLSKERQEGIQGYVEGKCRYRDKIGRKASNDIVVLQNQFKRYLETGVLNLRDKQRTLYSYFKKIKPELSKEDKKVIDTLYFCLSKERQDGIQGYIEGRYYVKDKIGRKASNDIVGLQHQFKRYLETGILNLRDKKITLYSYFKKIKPELSKEDKKVIDTLYFHLSKERQESIQGYIEGKCRSRDKIGRKAHNDIMILQRKFKRYLKTGILNLRDKKLALYSYFERIKPELSEEDKKVIDTLYSHLPKERQEGIQGYIDGRYHQTDKIGRRASNDIQLLKQQFKHYLEIESLEGCSKVQLKRKQVLLEALKVIEISFYRLGYTLSDYQKYKDEKMLDIVGRGNTSQLTILYIFIMESFYFIKEQEKIRAL